MARRWEDDIDENRSVWMAGAPQYEARPALSADTSADVALIGGGFTGCATAYELARRFPERRIVLLEARVIANGASGRNGGLMLNGVNGVVGEDAEEARRIFDVTRGAIDGIQRVIEEHALRVHWRRDGCLELYTDPARAEAAHARAERYAAAGIPVRFLDRAQLSRLLGVQGVLGAVLDPTAGQLDGVSYLRALRPVLAGLGVVIHENTPVLRVEPGRTIALVTPRAVVRAKALVLATNAYTARLGYFRDQFFPLHARMIATRPLGESERAAAGWGGVSGFSDDLDRVAFGAMTARAQIVFGGGSNAAYAYRFGGGTAIRGDGRAFAAVEQRLGRYLPAAREIPIAHRWSGPVALTLSRMCAMGVTGEHRNVYYAFGYSGHGIALSNLAGRVLCDIDSGDDQRWRALPFYMPRLPRLPPEPLRWLGYQLVTRATGRSPRR